MRVSYSRHQFAADTAASTKINLLEMENSFAHQNGGTTNPCSRNDTAFLLRPSYQSTWASHLYSLRDVPAKTTARLFLVVSQQSGECTAGASSRGVFRNTA